jgi:hypothetical protein
MKGALYVLFQYTVYVGGVVLKHRELARLTVDKSIRFLFFKAAYLFLIPSRLKSLDLPPRKHSVKEQKHCYPCQKSQSSRQIIGIVTTLSVSVWVSESVTNDLRIFRSIIKRDYNLRLACLFVCLSVCPHGTTRLQLDKFS